MKILMSTPYSLNTPGGVNHQALMLSKELIKYNHEVILVGPGTISENIPGLEFISTGKTFAFAFAHGSTANIQLLPDTTAIKKLLAHQQVDIIHLHEPLMPGINWWLLRRTPSIPKIGTFHAYHPFNLRYFLGKPLLKKLFNKLTGWVAVSEAAKHNVAQFFKADYQIIPNAIAIPTEAPANHSRQGLLFLGRFEPRKGLDVLLQAFNLLKNTNLNLYVIGRGDAAPYKKLITASHQARVHFLGGVDDATLEQYFKRCQIFISPARGYESFGIVLIQALSHGLPVIASDIPGYRDVLGKNGGGVLVPKNNSQELAATIEKLLANPQELQHMAKSAYVRAQSFDIQVTALAYNNYYKRIKNVF